MMGLAKRRCVVGHDGEGGMKGQGDPQPVALEPGSMPAVH